MIFTVVWAEPAQQQLATVWLASPDRNAVARASHEIDLTLREDPDAVGRRRFDSVRQFLRPPLGVDFEVNENDRLVTVLAVWAVPQS
jgi:hypothetical protein